MLFQLAMLVLHAPCLPTSPLPRPQARLVLSLALLAQGPANASPQTVSSTVDLVTGQLRVQGRTAYVAEGEGGWFSGRGGRKSSDE